MEEAPGSELARVGSYSELLAAIVARRKELGLSQLLTDEIAGLQSGYTGKIECGVKRLGMMSLGCVLGALGLELAVVRTTPHAEKQGRHGSRGRSDAGRDKSSRASADLRNAA